MHALSSFISPCYNLIHAHRSPPVDQQNSASTVETDQPEHRAVGTKRAGSKRARMMMPGSKRARMMPGSKRARMMMPGSKRARMMPDSKIVLPSSDVEEYSGNILRSTIFRIANPKGIYYLFDYNIQAEISLTFL